MPNYQGRAIFVGNLPEHVRVSHAGNASSPHAATMCHLSCLAHLFLLLPATMQERDLEDLFYKVRRPCMRSLKSLDACMQPLRRNSVPFTFAVWEDPARRSQAPSPASLLCLCRVCGPQVGACAGA